MKHWKKVISVMLTLTMVICLFSIAPVTANAAEAVTYTEYSWDGSALQTEVKTATDYTVVTSDLFKTNPEGLMTGTYVVNADTTIGDYFYIRKNQTVNLIVQPDTTLTCKKGIGCGYDKDGQFSTLNIYGTVSLR